MIIIRTSLWIWSPHCSLTSQFSLMVSNRTSSIFMKMKFGSRRLKTSWLVVRFVNPHSVEPPKTCSTLLDWIGKPDGTDAKTSHHLNGTRSADSFVVLSLVLAWCWWMLFSINGMNIVSHCANQWAMWMICNFSLPDHLKCRNSLNICWPSLEWWTSRWTNERLSFGVTLPRRGLRVKGQARGYRCPIAIYTQTFYRSDCIQVAWLGTFVA